METIDWSEWGLIIQDARILINFFTNRSVQHIKREGNDEATHILAKDALNSNVDVLELEVVPVCVKDIVMLDAS